VPLDLSERHTRALRTALELTRGGGTLVRLLHVVQRVPGLASTELQPFYRGLVQRSQRRLKRAAEPFTARGIPVTVDVRIGDAAREIVRATTARRVDLVVMGSHRVRPGRRSTGWGTTSYKVGILCQCPILLVK
jgi:nucleotide-binding universal stress UspA family protein